MRMTEKVISAQVVTATGNLALGQAPDWALQMTVYVNATAVSGTTPSLTPTLNGSPDNVLFAQALVGTALVATGTQRFALLGNAGRFNQLSNLVSGTTPSFTLDVWVEYRG